MSKQTKLIFGLVPVTLTVGGLHHFFGETNPIRIKESIVDSVGEAAWLHTGQVTI